ncbi:hypothetical protein BZG36_01917 [Bifiguratus adelaidae]|uniref:37S ribosomal protein S35, mitochondrial n=1 Tax=Bifiguratus adelaidae TaxID=1938954 RepID=A0A261Y4L1_9FUNG|nr:hypothetical protein BZG36_01917 [Bifiguratus adelaidae]
MHCLQRAVVRSSFLGRGLAQAPTRRLLQTSPFLREEENANVESTIESQTAEQSETPRTTRRRRKFIQWLNSEGEKYKNPSPGQTNYLRPDQPYPLNPEFKPRAPVADTVKEQIYETYLSDPRKWTPRQLGTKYQLAIKRVEAILRLKAAEKRMEKEGFVLQTDFNRGMERLMGVTSNHEHESLTEIIPNVGKPAFKLIDEEQQFTPEDAARELGRKPFATMQQSLLESQLSKPFELHVQVNDQTTFVKKETTLGNARHKFVFIDQAKGRSNKETMIRDRDGTLRTATRGEKGHTLMSH